MDDWDVTSTTLKFTIIGLMLFAHGAALLVAQHALSDHITWPPHMQDAITALEIWLFLSSVFFVINISARLPKLLSIISLALLNTGIFKWGFKFFDVDILPPNTDPLAGSSEHYSNPSMAGTVDALQYQSRCGPLDCTLLARILMGATLAITAIIVVIYGILLIMQCVAVLEEKPWRKSRWDYSTAPVSLRDGAKDDFEACIDMAAHEGDGGEDTAVRQEDNNPEEHIAPVLDSMVPTAEDNSLGNTVPADRSIGLEEAEALHDNQLWVGDSEGMAHMALGQRSVVHMYSDP
ncbi:hypothetical protein CVT25_000210 [Psilocybe cyanescens]|uniref:Uncharacterized protein n=1 Tax=Psilocybe cyanescens TaxID=93625 RepID=A0A409XQD6_PSICY|nr:hypothetical protein CVT25_000210 [Psilocybe cyanescens]